MGSIQGKLTLAPGPLTTMQKDIDGLPETFEKSFEKNTVKPLADFNKAVQTVPSRLPSHPFIWSKVKSLQAKARRWWFAAIAGKIPGVNIETQNGRYKRKSNKIDAGATIDKTTGEITIEVPGGGFGMFAVGKQQVPSHKQTGWVRFDKEVEKLEDELTDVAFDTWFNVSEEVGSK